MDTVNRKLFIMIAMIMLSFKSVAGLGQCYALYNPPGIPQFGTVVQWLDGTISGNEFVDKSGHNYNADIIDNDIDVVGFPYKSKAFIRQKAANFGIIPNPNNFWFQSDGTPNDVPVVSLFQDIDYLHQIFCKNIPSTKDTYGFETTQARVVDIVTYSSAVTGSNLVRAYSYFSVPTKNASAKWIDPLNGSDVSGNGSELLPYASIIKTEAQTYGSNQIIYIRTGTIVLSAQLNLTKRYNYVGIGFVKITTNQTSIVIQKQTTIGSIKGVYFSIVPSSTYLVFDNTGGENFYRCRFDQNNTYCHFSYLHSNPVTDSSNVFMGNNTGAILYASTSSNYRLVDNYYGATPNGCVITNSAGTMTGSISILNNKFRYSSVLTSDVILFNNANTYIINILGNDMKLSDTTQNARSVIAIWDKPWINISRNKIYSGGIVSPILVASLGTNVTTSCNINYNDITYHDASGYAIKVGTETTGVSDNYIRNASITGNLIHGRMSFFTSEASTEHNIFVGFNKNAVVKYNHLIGSGYGIVLKATVLPYDSGGIFYNIIQDGNFAVVGVTDSLKIYNNTFINNNVGVYVADPLPYSGRHAEVYNNIFVCKAGKIAINFNSSSWNLSDYNVFFAPGDSVWFSYNGTILHSLAAWQAATGQDLHSVLVNPNFLPGTFVPSTPIVGYDLGAKYNTGLDPSTVWPSGIVTRQQGATWQVGAFIKP